jgi:hypothetical protein
MAEENLTKQVAELEIRLRVCRETITGQTAMLADLTAAFRLLHNTVKSVDVCRQIAATALAGSHFVCAGCHELRPNEEGGTDEMPDHCANCWVKEHGALRDACVPGLHAICRAGGQRRRPARTVRGLRAKEKT